MPDSPASEMPVEAIDPDRVPTIILLKHASNRSFCKELPALNRSETDFFDVRRKTSLTFVSFSCL